MYNGDEDENSIVNYNDNDVNSNSNSSSSESKTDVKVDKPRVKFLKDKIGISVFLGINTISSILMTLFTPLLFQKYVEHHHPSYTRNEVDSLASRYKSIADALPYVCAFLLSPVLGALSDRYGRKVVLSMYIISSLLNFSTAQIGYQYLIIWPFYITSTVAGISNSALAMLFSYLADLSKPDERPRLYSVMGGALGLSVLVGPVIGGLTISHLKASYLLLISAILQLLSGIVLLSIVESTKYKEGELILPHEIKKREKLNLNPFKSVFMVFKSSRYIGAYTLLYIMFTYCVQDSLVTSYLYTNVRYGWGPTEYAYYEACIGLSISLFSGLILPLLLKYFHERVILTFAFLSCSIYHVLYAFSVNQYMWSIVSFFGAFSIVILNLGQAILSKATPSNTQGTLLSGVSGVASLSSFAGALISQNIFSYFISDSAPFYFPGMHFLIDGGVVFITFIMAVVFLKMFPLGDKKYESANEVDEEASDPLLINEDSHGDEEQPSYRVSISASDN